MACAREVVVVEEDNYCSSLDSDCKKGRVLPVEIAGEEDSRKVV